MPIHRSLDVHVNVVVDLNVVLFVFIFIRNKLYSCQLRAITNRFCLYRLQNAVLMRGGTLPQTAGRPRPAPTGFWLAPGWCAWHEKLISLFDSNIWGTGLQKISPNPLCTSRRKNDKRSKSKFLDVFFDPAGRTPQRKSKLFWIPVGTV